MPNPRWLPLVCSLCLAATQLPPSVRAQLTDGTQPTRARATDDLPAASVADLFAQLATFGPLPAAELRREVRHTFWTNRVRLALNFGALVGDGFLIIQARDRSRVAPLGREMLRRAQALRGRAGAGGPQPTAFAQEPGIAPAPPAAVACSRVATREPVVALTFDDGPHATLTPQLLDVLKAHHVHATFFVIGMNVEQNPDVLRRIVAEGHEVGNHSWSHPNLAKLPEEAWRGNSGKPTTSSRGRSGRRRASCARPTATSPRRRKRSSARISATA